MKKTLIFFGLLAASGIVLDQINFLDHLLAFLFIGLIPYTNTSIPPLAMFFAWLSLPIVLFSLVAIIKGLFILSLIAAEHVDRSIVAYRLSRIESATEIKLVSYLRNSKVRLANWADSISSNQKRRIAKLSSDTN